MDSLNIHNVTKITAGITHRLATGSYVKTLVIHTTNSVLSIELFNDKIIPLENVGADITSHFNGPQPL